MDDIKALWAGISWQKTLSGCDATKTSNQLGGFVTREFFFTGKHFKFLPLQAFFINLLFICISRSSSALLQIFRNTQLTKCIFCVCIGKMLDLIKTAGASYAHMH